MPLLQKMSTGRCDPPAAGGVGQMGVSVTLRISPSGVCLQNAGTMKTLRLFAAISLAVLATTVAASPHVDQDAPYGEETIVVGGERNVVVSQSVTAGLTGGLMRIEVGVGCDGGTLILEIVNLDPPREAPRVGAPVRSSVTIDAASIPNPPAPRTFELDRWLSMNAGDRFAIVLRNETGSCTLMKGAMAVDGSSYPDGEAFFRRAVSDGWSQFLDFGKTGDIGFKTIVNVVPSSRPCIASGFTLPFPHWVPVCRCLEDEGLRDFRCALMHPEYFLFRNLPVPIRAAKPFEVKWTLVVYAPMKGFIELVDPLNPKGPLTFFVDQVPVGESITLTYQAIAPLKAGRHKIEVTVGDGKMQSFIDVIP